MKKNYKMRVTINPLEEGGYLAICENLKGCHAEGKTPKEALENLKDVAQKILELCEEENIPIPSDFEIPERIDSPLLLELLLSI